MHVTFYQYIFVAIL